MVNHDQDAARENEALKRRFGQRGLNWREVIPAVGADLDQENRRLRHLLGWVRAYAESPDRATLRVRGYLRPPAADVGDLEGDWQRFETWVRRGRSTISFAALVAEAPPSALLGDDEVVQSLEQWRRALSAQRVFVELADGLPDRLLYDYLRDHLIEAHFDAGDGSATHHVTGCTGYCPECIQRPWCGIGESQWPEDEAAGVAVVPDAVRPYLSSSGVSQPNSGPARAR